MIPVNVGGVPNVAMIVDSGASCNVTDRKLWEQSEVCIYEIQQEIVTIGGAEPFKQLVVLL